MAEAFAKEGGERVVRQMGRVGGAGERFAARRMARFGQTGGKMKKRLEFKL